MVDRLLVTDGGADQGGRVGEVRLPLDEFEATTFGRGVKDAGLVDTHEVNALGFMLGDKRAGPFESEVEYVKVVRPVRGGDRTTNPQQYSL